MTVINHMDLPHPNGFEKRLRTDAIILHHPVMNGSVKDVNRVHLDRGFNGIGYHLYVRKDGSIWLGRPLVMKGAGIRPDGKYSNANTLHICAEGNFMVDEMDEVQLNGVIEAIQYVRKVYGNIPAFPHKAVNNTDCPGDNYPLKTILKQAKEIVMGRRYRVTVPSNRYNYNYIKDKIEELTGYKFHIVAEYKLQTTATEYALKYIIETSPYKVYYEELKDA